MNISTISFSSKIEEFNNCYEMIHKDLAENKIYNHETIKNKIEILLKLLKEEEEKMQKVIRYSSCDALVQMSCIQKEYELKMKDILENKLASYMHFKKEDPLGEMEESALYAEYAIDYAIHSLRLAKLSIFLAMEKELLYRENQKEEL